MTFIGQYPADYRAEQCQYCGVAIERGLLYPACRRCDTRNIFSDIYKDDVGVRPDLSQWSLREMRNYLDRRRAQ